MSLGNICGTDEIKMWLKPGVVRESFGENGFVWVQCASGLF